MTHLALGAGAEFDRIREILRVLGDHAAASGDDCGEVPAGSGTLVVSTDASVEGVHFERAWLTPREIGWRAAAAALSDLAADGATCVGVVAAVSLPAADAHSLAEVMVGVGDAAAVAGGRVLGGDVTRAPVLTITVTVLGRAERRVTRSGARPGDGLWLTGALGGPRAALLDWRGGRAADRVARDAFAHPIPGIAVGRLLARAGARAMIDVSDGLAADARHLAAASAVALRIELEQVPLNAAVEQAARSVGVEPALFAAAGGEDYELLAAMDPGFDVAAAAAITAECGARLTRIGEVAAGAGVELRYRGTPVAVAGYDHFG